MGKHGPQCFLVHRMFEEGRKEGWIERGREDRRNEGRMEGGMGGREEEVREEGRNSEIHMETVLQMGKEKGTMGFAWENWDGFSKEVVTDLDSEGS